MSTKHFIDISSNGGPQLRLEFSKSGDRWSHRWLLVDGDVESVVMTSVEGTPDQDWPPSPPLQDVSDHELPNGNAILGVGMAGKSHWSASLASITQVGEQSSEIIRCEFACLQKGISESDSSQASLGSCYELSSEFSSSGISENKIEIVDSKTGAKLLIETIVGAEWGSQLGFTDSQLSIQPTVISESPVRSTQWGFQLTIAR